MAKILRARSHRSRSEGLFDETLRDANRGLDDWKGMREDKELVFTSFLLLPKSSALRFHGHCPRLGSTSLLFIDFLDYR